MNSAGAPTWRRTANDSGSMNTSFFGEMLQTIAERGRALIDRTRDRREVAAAALGEPGPALRGAAVGPRRSLGRRAGARDPHTLCGAHDRPPHRLLRGAGHRLWPRPHAARCRRSRPGCNSSDDEAAAEVHRASEPRRLELFRRLNLAPDGTAALVRMREQLLDAMDASRRPRDQSTPISSTCSRPGSTAASWCCAASTGRRRRACSRRSSATRRCTRSSDWDDLRAPHRSA